MFPKTYLVSGDNSQKYRLNGINPSARLPRNHNLRQAFQNHVLYQPNQLPSKVDLRPYMTPVENQSQIGSCTANCLAGAYEYVTKRATGRDIDVSRLFIYYNGRIIDGQSQSVTDSGCSMTNAIEALEAYGTCLESTWPYDISQVNTRPSDQAYQEAQYHKITEALKLNINLDEMKSCLAQGFPFAFGLKLFSSFDQAAQTGIVPMPSAKDLSRQKDGSHALLAVGYSDQSQAFIVRNSWGANWGEQGYCYIPYNYITNSTYSFDVWTVRKLATDNFGQDHWVSNDSNIHSRMSGYHHSHGHPATIRSANESDGDGDNDFHHRRTNFDDPWDQFHIYGGSHRSRRHRSPHSHKPHRDFFGGNNLQPSFNNLNQPADNFSGFRSGSPNFAPFFNEDPAPVNGPFGFRSPNSVPGPFGFTGSAPLNGPFGFRPLAPFDDSFGFRGPVPRLPIFGLNYQYEDSVDRYFNPFY